MRVNEDYHPSLSVIFFAGSFYRNLVPQDVLIGEPKPDTWGEPVAMLLPGGCDPMTNFVNHSIVFGEFKIDFAD